MKNYTALLHRDAYQKALSYMESLKKGGAAGKYLQSKLNSHPLSKLSLDDFIELLMQTKVPQIFAETSVYGNGTDWNHSELSILGDINISIPVTVFDNGKHDKPQAHSSPFDATLIFIAGALLRNGKYHEPADWNEVTINNEVNFESYYQLYKRRLLPALMYANQSAKSKGTTACITLSGIGCGQFAGQFKGQLGEQFKQVLKRILRDYSEQLLYIKAVYYDPFSECNNERHQINQITFLVRPLLQGNETKHQLCPPHQFEEHEDKFSECDLFSFVAWDHVSWPGNDFYSGNRITDDGVKSAATDAMYALTDIKGEYDVSLNKYMPPTPYKNWQEVVDNNKIQLHVKNNLIIVRE